MSFDERQLWKAARPTPLPPEALRRIRARLQSTLAPAPVRIGRRWPSLPVTVFLLTVGGAAGASVLALVHRVPAPEPTVAPTNEAPPRSRARGVRPEVVVPAAPVTIPAVPPEIPAAPEAPAVPERHAGSSGSPRQLPRVLPQDTATTGPTQPPPLELALPEPLAPPAPLAKPAAPERLAVEAQLLGSAVRALRVENDAHKALVLLDQFAWRFPDASLGSEATLARIDSLGRLGRDESLLELLDDLTLAGMPRAPELRVLRGELRLRAGRLKAAATDFESALAAGGSDGLGERALYGRASCRGRLGDAAGARADMLVYLARYPQGPHAGEIRARVLDGTP